MHLAGQEHLTLRVGKLPRLQESPDPQGDRDPDKILTVRELRYSLVNLLDGTLATFRLRMSRMYGHL